MPHVDRAIFVSGHPELWCVAKRSELGAFEVMMGWDIAILGVAVQPWELSG